MPTRYLIPNYYPLGTYNYRAISSTEQYIVNIDFTYEKFIAEPQSV